MYLAERICPISHSTWNSPKVIDGLRTGYLIFVGEPTVMERDHSHHQWSREIARNTAQYQLSCCFSAIAWPTIFNDDDLHFCSFVCKIQSGIIMTPVSAACNRNTTDCLHRSNGHCCLGVEQCSFKHDPGKFERHKNDRITVSEFEKRRACGYPLNAVVDFKKENNYPYINCSDLFLNWPFGSNLIITRCESWADQLAKVDTEN